jgi:hypothetical protein
LKKNTQLKKTIKLFLPFITLCTIISCQKEVDDFGAVVNPPTPTNDSIYLDKIYELYDDGSGLDTQSILTVNYDVQKRISGWQVNDPGGTPFISYNYYYNGSDSIPNKSLFIEFNNSVQDSTTTFHTYDASGRNLRDSSFYNFISYGNTGYSTFDYTYNADKRFGTGKRVYLQPTPTSVNYLDTITIDGNGNFLSSMRYSDYNNGTMQLSSQANYTYDNKASPFSRQHIYKAHQFSPNGETLFYEYISYSNIVSHLENNIILGSTPFDDDYSYTYNSNNLPVKATIVYGTDTTFMYYTYKPL